MTCKKKFDLLDDWYKRSIVIAYYHDARKKARRKHTIAESAKYFGMSSAYISEALSIAKYKKKVKHASSREQALRIIRTLL